MPLSLDLVLDRLQGLQSELQREKAARAKLEQRTTLLERTLERHAEDLDSLLEVVAAPASAPIGGGHARKLDRWLDGDGAEGRGTDSSAKVLTSHGHAVTRVQIDELRSAHQDLAQRVDTIENDCNRRSRNEDAVHAAIQQLEDSVRSATTSAQLQSLETTLLTKANDASLETASQAHRIDQLEEELASQGQETFSRFQIEQQRRLEGLEASRAEMEKLKKDLLNIIRSHHEVALGAVQRFKETERQRRDTTNDDATAPEPVHAGLSMPPPGTGEERRQQHLSLMKASTGAGAAASGATAIRKVAGRQRVVSVGATRDREQGNDSRASNQASVPRLPQRSSSPGRSGVSPGRSGVSSGRSGVSPGRSGVSPGRSGSSNIHRRQPHSVQQRSPQLQQQQQQQQPPAPPPQQQQQRRRRRGRAGQDQWHDGGSVESIDSRHSSHVCGDALNQSHPYEREGSFFSDDVASVTNSEYSSADAEEMAEAELSYPYARSDLQRYSADEHTIDNTGNIRRTGKYSYGHLEDYPGSEAEYGTETELSDELDTDAPDNPSLSLGERRRQLEEQRAAVREKQLRLAAVTKALGRYGGQAAPQLQRKAKRVSE